MEQKQRFKSPSTDGVAHDVYNLLVEAILINRYGLLPSGAWRKGSQLADEWGEMVKIVKRLCKTMDIEPTKLAWYVQKYSVTHLDYEEFGLVRWKVKRMFGWTSIEDFRKHYDTLYNSQIRQPSAYVENTTTYKVKEAAPKKKTLQQILEEIENGTQG